MTNKVVLFICSVFLTTCLLGDTLFNKPRVTFGTSEVTVTKVTVILSVKDKNYQYEGFAATKKVVEKQDILEFFDKHEITPGEVFTVNGVVFGLTSVNKNILD